MGSSWRLEKNNKKKNNNWVKSPSVSGSPAARKKQAYDDDDNATALAPSPMMLDSFLLLFACFSLAGFAPSPSSASPDEHVISVLEAVSDVVQNIAATKNWNINDIHISNVDSEGVKFTKAIVYELDIKVDEKKILPIKFIDEVAKWQNLADFEKISQDQDHLGRVSKVVWGTRSLQSVLAPFQLKGPVVLSFSKISHDSFQETEAQLTGVNMVTGSSVEVHGASEVSLQHPVESPLPINSSSPIRSLAMSILSLTTESRKQGLEDVRSQLSLRIKGSTMVASVSGLGILPDTVAQGSGAVKFLYKDDNLAGWESAFDSSKILNEASIWPFPLINFSNPNMFILDKILKVRLGSRTYRRSFTILHAKVSASTFVLFEFEIQRKLNKEDFDPVLWPHWKTRPDIARYSYQVLAKFKEGLVPILVKPLKRGKNVETYARKNVSNVSYPSSTYLYPPSPMTLDIY